MLLAEGPIPLVPSAIGPGVKPKAMLTVHLIIPLIPSPVLPGVDAFAMHVIIQPISVVLSSIIPEICSPAGNFIFVPFAFILRTVCPNIHSWKKKTWPKFSMAYRGYYYQIHVSFLPCNSLRISTHLPKFLFPDPLASHPSKTPRIWLHSYACTPRSRLPCPLSIGL